MKVMATGFLYRDCFSPVRVFAAGAKSSFSIFASSLASPFSSARSCSLEPSGTIEKPLLAVDLPFEGAGAIETQGMVDGDCVDLK